MVRLGWIRSDLVGFGRIWSDLIGFGPIQSDSVGFGRIWSDSVGFGTFLTVFSSNCKMAIVLSKKSVNVEKCLLACGGTLIGPTSLSRWVQIDVYLIC